MGSGWNEMGSGRNGMGSGRNGAAWGGIGWRVGLGVMEMGVGTVGWVGK